VQPSCLLDDPRARAAMAELSAIIEHEQTRFLETLPFERHD
jgi:hypothetical protein